MWWLYWSDNDLGPQMSVWCVRCVCGWGVRVGVRVVLQCCAVFVGGECGCVVVLLRYGMIGTLRCVWCMRCICVGGCGCVSVDLFVVVYVLATSK